MDEETLKLCLIYSRCRGCGRLKPRGLHYINYCPLCRHGNKKQRKAFLEWYEKEGEPLENILPNPMPPRKELEKMLAELRRKKK